MDGGWISKKDQMSIPLHFEKDKRMIKSRDAEPRPSPKPPFFFFRGNGNSFNCEAIKKMKTRRKKKKKKTDVQNPKSLLLNKSHLFQIYGKKKFFIN